MAEDTAARKIDVPSELRVISCRVVNLNERRNKDSNRRS